MNRYHLDFKLIHKKSDYSYSPYKEHLEAKEYQGCEYIWDNQLYIRRTAKITPKKVGGFVTLWSRSSSGRQSHIVNRNLVFS